MSGLTKEQLKNELITHGVELPPSVARKDEYVRLYEKYVAPVEQAKGDFSSDDEDSPIVPIEKVNMEQSLVVDGLDISTLGDDELYKRLSELGATVGPIVDSTRSVYQKKLLVLMGGDVPDSPTFNGDVDEEEYSDSEEIEEEKVEKVVTSQVENTTSPPPSEMSDIRKRVLLSSAGEAERSDVIFDPSKHTPSPRRSLRSVTSSTTTTTTYESKIFKNVNNGRSGLMNATASPTNVSTEEEEEEQEQDRKSKISLIVRLLVKLLFLGLIIALILYIYQNDPSESPFKAVEQLARQALEAAVGEEAEVKEQGKVESVTTPDIPPQPEDVPEVH